MKRNACIRTVALSLSLASSVLFAHPSAVIAQTPRENTEARKLWTEGRDLYDEGNFVDAERKFREALNRYPKSDQADRTTYYLIVTLEKLRRYRDANAEIETFHRSFPGSRWSEDVDERSMALGVTSSSLLQQQAKIAREHAESEKRGSTVLPPNASVDAMVLRMIIQANPGEGMEKVKERLKIDASDPAAIANLGTIFSSNSPQVLPFLLELSNSAASNNVRTIAFFFAMRRNPDKLQVANTLMEMLNKKDNEDIVSEALFRMTYQEHRAVLAKIVESPNPGKFDAIEKIYRKGSITLRSDLLTAVSTLKEDSRAESFILDAAQNDKDLTVRRVAISALVHLKGSVDVKTLETLLSPQPRKPAAGPPMKAPTPPSAPSKQNP